MNDNEKATAFDYEEEKSEYSMYSKHPIVPDFGAIVGGRLTREAKTEYEYVFTDDDDNNKVTNQAINKYLKVLAALGYRFEEIIDYQVDNGHTYGRVLFNNEKNSVNVICGKAYHGNTAIVIIEYYDQV